MYYRKANAAMLIYDITSSDSFYDIKDWVSGKYLYINALPARRTSNIGAYFFIPFFGLSAVYCFQVASPANFS